MYSYTNSRLSLGDRDTVRNVSKRLMDTYDRDRNGYIDKNEAGRSG